MSPEPLAQSPTCASCGAELGLTLLACPACGALVHAASLKRLASDAEAAEAAGDVSAALAALRAALDLLPRTSRQYAVLSERVERLSATVGAPPPTKSSTSRAGLGAAGALALGLLAKGKLLLAGLTKLSTLASMLVAFGAYFTLWGWRFALGVLVTTYVHEMGHVVALRRYGIAATAPMFIPGFGAFVRLRQPPRTVLEDARIGLAGPIWGTVASAIAGGIGLALGWPSWSAIGRISAWINLFNLLPFGSLDGGRAFRALGRVERAVAAVALVVAWVAASDGLLLLLALVAAARTFGGEAPARGSRAIAVEYVALVAALTALAARGPAVN